MNILSFRQNAFALLALLAIFAASAPASSAQTADVTIISDTRDMRVERGSDYRLRFTIENTGSTTIRGGVFVEIDVPGGGTVVRRVENTVLAPGATQTIRFKERVRANAPQGDYTVRASFESIDRTVVYDSETAMFRVGGSN